jgi:hypothetical protein
MMIMSKTNDASNLSHDTPNDHRPLADSELDAVSGGWSLSGIPGTGGTPTQLPHVTGRLKMGDIQLK